MRKRKLKRNIKRKIIFLVIIILLVGGFFINRKTDFVTKIKDEINKNEINKDEINNTDNGEEGKNPAKEILKDCNLYSKVPTLVACPTCGRTQIDLIPIAKKVEEFLQTIESDITVAVMGCSVNGPGEAREADIGIAGGVKEGLLFKKGEIIKKVKQEEIVEELEKEILKMIKYEEE